MQAASLFHRSVRTVLLGASLSFLLAGCATAKPAKRPRAEIFDQEVVKIEVDYRNKKISVAPESVKVFLQWDEKRKDRLKPVQARWVVEGLKRGHRIYIVAKKDAPKVEFPYPSRYEGRPAFMIDGKNNSIRSGEPLSIPGLKKGKGYSKRDERYTRGEGKPYSVTWSYDVVVTDRNGREIFSIDPQLIIVGHP